MDNGGEKRLTRKQYERLIREYETATGEAPTMPCSRCGTVAECAPMGILGNSEGQVIDPCVLCSGCRGVQMRDNDAFWSQGWEQHPWVRRDSK